jgi:hypothetical protein
MEKFSWEPVLEVTDLKPGEETLNSADGGQSGTLYGIIEIKGSLLFAKPIHDIDQAGTVIPISDQATVVFDLADPTTLSLFYQKNASPEGSPFVDLPREFVLKTVKELRDNEKDGGI